MILLSLSVLNSGCDPFVRKAIKNELYECPKVTRPVLMEINKDSHVGSVEKQKEILSDMNLITKYALDLETTVNCYESQIDGFNNAKLKK